MKKSLIPIFAASTLLLNGCCTSNHVTKWEYKVVAGPDDPGKPFPQDWREREQRFLNDLGKDGWVLVQELNGQVFYLKRPIK
jgi:Domain of unknown function (DUF4177)